MKENVTFSLNKLLQSFPPFFEILNTKISCRHYGYKKPEPKKGLLESKPLSLQVMK